MSSTLAPVIYIPHGGGPLPLLNDPHHLALNQFLTQLGKTLNKPAAILVISAHWEHEHPSLTSADQPELLFDYYGFADESYRLTYPCDGAPDLARNIAKKLNDVGLISELDDKRGLDHGVFVPLLMLRPQADVPVLQLSLIKGLDAAKHIALGEAISFLRAQNVLILGSGMSFHNMQAFFKQGLVSEEQVSDFNQYITSSLTTNLSFQEQKEALTAWQSAPNARLVHPREEHLLPLHVCLGAAKDSPKAKLIFEDKILNKTVLAFSW